MATGYTVLNDILVLLREDEVDTGSAVSGTYEKLVIKLMNQAKRKVEDAWNWVQLRNTVQVTTSANNFRYTLTGAGNRSVILQVLDDTNDSLLHVAPYTWLNIQFNTSDTIGKPLYYDINGNVSGDPNVDLWPVPDGAYIINFNMKTPQDDYTTSVASLSTALTVPEYPVILGAYALALRERGEDNGVRIAEADIEYRMALSDAIAIDTNTTPDELIWTVD